MKKLILLLILGTACIIGYSQTKYPKKEPVNLNRIKYDKEEIIFELPENNIEVKLGEKKYYNALPYTYSSLYVYCRTHCSEWKSSEIVEIFDENTYSVGRDIPELARLQEDEVFKNEKTVDSLFQNLYDWIKEIEDFAISHRGVGDTITMKYHNIYDSRALWDRYHLKTYHSYIKISTEKYLRDQAGYWCVRWTKMKLKTITEFKKRLLNYTASHNIVIKL